MRPSMAANDDDLPEADGAPPEADTVALRALAVAALLRRLDLEERKAPKAEFEALDGWVEQNGLYASFSEGGFALFDAEPNSWNAEDQEAVAWGAEELLVLTWALGKAESPGVFTRAARAPLLGLVPASGPVEPFSLAAALRPDLQVEEFRALYQTLANAGRLEAWARGVAADPTLLTDDEELEVLLQGLEPGQREALTEKHGAAGAAVEVLRTLSQTMVTELFGEAKSALAAYAFEPAKLATLDDEALAHFLAIAQIRAEASSWLCEGDDWAAAE
jgi:Domain of unknown function (DUF4272)